MPGATVVVQEAGEALAALDLDQAQAAGAEGLQRVGGAELRDLGVGERRGPHDRGARGNGHGRAVDFERDGVGRLRRRRAEVAMVDRVHLASSRLRPEVFREVLHGALDGEGGHAPEAAQGRIQHRIAEFLDQGKLAITVFTSSDAARASAPRTEPIRQGVHLPQDSCAQNSMA